jgi:hypothetical protein
MRNGTMLYGKRLNCVAVMIAGAVLAGCSRSPESPANAPATRTGTPPDLSGPWQVSAGQGALKTADGMAPPLLPAAASAYAANQAAKARGENGHDSMARCVPPGVPRLSLQAFPWDIVQGKRHIMFVYEWNHLHRLVYMNEGGHFEAIGPTYLGQSVGRWEGDALVVDTHTFNGKTLLDDAGLPASDALHTLERYRLIDGGAKLELSVTITDPNNYAQSWVARVTFDRQPGAVLKEDYCFRRVGIVK